MPPDNRYFAAADRVVKLKDGCVVGTASDGPLREPLLQDL